MKRQLKYERMIYTDGTHLVGTTIFELHTFAEKVGLKRHFFHGARKGHPHYDMTFDKIKHTILHPNRKEEVTPITSRQIVRLFQIGGLESNRAFRDLDESMSEDKSRKGNKTGGQFMRTRIEENGEDPFSRKERL